MTCEPWSKIIILLLLLLLKIILIILIMLIIIIIILVIYYYHYCYNSNIDFFQESKIHIDPFASKISMLIILTIIYTFLIF